MVEWMTRIVERLLRIPPAPTAPPGDEGTTRVFRAARSYYTYRLIGWTITRIAALLGLIAAASSTYIALSQLAPLGDLIGLVEIFVGVAFLGQTVLSYFALRLDYQKRWYLVTDRSLRIREGVVNVREMTITFANIQNISISQGPLQRVFGISDVRVDTAGGSSGSREQQHGMMSLHTAFFRGVDNADRIRSLIQQRLRELRDTGLGDLDEAAAAPETGVGANVGGREAMLAVLRQIRAEARGLRLDLG